jgi:hypothetical protein
MGNLGSKPALVALTSGDLGADIVTAAKIADDVLNSEHYAAASIDNEHLADNAVGTDEIADNAITLAKMASGTDGNIISFDASGNPVAIATGSDGQVLTSAGAGAPPAFEAAAGGGKVLQVVHVENGATLTHTTVMPADNTVNTSSEGGELFTLAVTPANASNKLIIQYIVHCSHSAANNFITGNLYQDSTSASINTINSTVIRTASDTFSMVGWHYMTAGTTSATTFKVRAGANNGGTFRMNGSGAVQHGGGTLLSGMTIWELSA